MVLLHGHLQIKLFEARDVGRAFYSKKSIIKSICKGLAQNAKQAIQKQKRADRDCYVAVYAGTAFVQQFGNEGCLYLRWQFWSSIPATYCMQ